MRQSLEIYRRSSPKIEKDFHKVWCKELLKKPSYLILNFDHNLKNSKVNNF